jgi:outer membrane murein-binding lipoprotein Lpp
MNIKSNGPLVTYETVAAACEALTTEGLKPSVRAVIARLGGGSPNVVLDFQRQWKSGRPVVRPHEIQIDARVNQIIAEQITQAIAVASASAEAERAEAEETLDMVSKASKEADKKITALTDELELANTKVQTLNGQIGQLNTTVQQIKEDATAAIKAAEDRAAAEIAKMAAELTTERTAAETTRMSLAKAELRLESVPRIEMGIDKLRVELQLALQQANEQHEEAAVAMAKLAGAERIVTAATAAASENVARAQQAETLARKATEEAAELRGQISVLNKQLAAIKPAIKPKGE